MRARACLKSTKEIAFMTSHIEFGVDLFAELLIRRFASRFLVLEDSAGKLSSVVRERGCLKSTKEIAFMTSHIEFGVDLFADILIGRFASRFLVLKEAVGALSLVVRGRACLKSTKEIAFMTSHIEFAVDLFAGILIGRVASRFLVLKD